MVKVNVHLGFTFRVGELSSNQYGRIDLNVDQIDTELPVQEQLEKSKEAVDMVWDFVRTKVDTQLEHVLDESKNG